MASTLVDRVQFEQRLSEELQRRFTELHAEGAVEEAGELLRATISVEFVVSARKKPKPDRPPLDVCCVCIRSGGLIICSGDCCPAAPEPAPGPLDA